MSNTIDEDSASSDSDTPNEKVGYKKPPKQHQFKKGESGNPKGSKKHEKLDDIRIVMEDVLADLVKATEGGKPRILSMEEAIMEAELRNALSGNPRAIEALFKRAQKCGLFSKAKSKRGPIIEDLKGDNGKIVRMFYAEQEALQTAAPESAGRTHKIFPRKAGGH